ncbi:MAG TPA: rhomboid family intramembrane serine protease [Pyrinomonadaceae bacterium]|nr:rhomboid family intramembrane serine protease [Pyrinomonadaceae bacterium]
MCRNCRAIIGAGEDHCAVCGAVAQGNNSPEIAHHAADRETLRFARAILGRPYKFTIILLIANFLIFLLMWQSSGLHSHIVDVFSPQVLLAYGAKQNFLIRVSHQWWRFVTPMFVHVNILHLMVNMYSLWVVGPYVEKLYGSAKFVVFWVLTGIAAVFASYLTVGTPSPRLGPLGKFLFRPEDVPSAGASGALFGLVGVLFIFGIKFRHELPEGFKRAFGTGMLPIILINLFIGYLGRGFIDNAAHLGGLVSGAALALVVGYRRPGAKAGMAFFWYVLQVAAIALVAISFFKVVQHFPHPLAAPVNQAEPLREENVEFLNFAQAMNKAQEVFYSVVARKDASEIDGALKALESAPSLNANADELRESLKPLLIKAKKLNDDRAAADERAGKELRQREHELIKEFGAWSQKYNEWLKTEGKNYAGLQEVSGSPSP